MRDLQHGHFRHGYRYGNRYGNYLHFGGNFIDSQTIPDTYPPKCKSCQQQHESSHWREDIDKILCDACYAKEIEDGQEES